MKYSRIYLPKELEKACFMSDLAVKEIIKKAGINKDSFKYLVIANLITDKEQYFTKRGIESALGAVCYANVSERVNELVRLGYIEEVVQARNYSYAGSLKRRSAGYVPTGKAVYLIRKYTDLLNKMMQDERF